MSVMKFNLTVILILVITTITIDFGHKNSMVVSGQCEEDIASLITQCAKYVRKEGPKTAPSAACCGVAKKANIPCLCKYVTKQIENYISVEKAVYVAQYCGVHLKHGSKCGSYTIPPA